MVIGLVKQHNPVWGGLTIIVPICLVLQHYEKPPRVIKFKVAKWNPPFVHKMVV